MGAASETFQEGLSNLGAFCNTEGNDQAEGADSRGSLGCLSAAEREPGQELLLATTAGVSGLSSWGAGYNSSPRNGAERIWSPTAQELLWEQTAAELALGWHLQADTAGIQRCTESRGPSLEKQ